MVAFKVLAATAVLRMLERVTTIYENISPMCVDTFVDLVSTTVQDLVRVTSSYSY